MPPPSGPPQGPSGPPPGPSGGVPAPPPGGYPPPSTPGGYGPPATPGGYGPPGGYGAPPGYGGPPGGYGAPPGYGGPPQPPKKGLSDGAKYGILGGAAVLVIVLIVGILVFAGDDEASAGEIFLDPAGEVGNDPFTDSVSVSGEDRGITGTATGGGSTGDTGDTVEVVSATGSEPGLYGGTQDQSSCDREQLIEFLIANQDKARAWAGVEGIAVADIPDYIRTLTPMRLRFDTRVTNHGFRDGRATPYQTVLQAGTAVLVDSRGVPRARCACGNPLLEPRATSRTPTFTGTPWTGFSPGNLQRITIVQNIDIFVITNITNNVSTNVTFTRPAGTDGGDDAPGSGGTTTTTGPPDTTGTTEPALGTGDVQVTLRWSGGSDVDLHVTDPNGEEISFSSTTSSSGGQLDVDCIPGSSCPADGPHVENVFWPTGAAPEGDYTAFARNLGDATDFTLTVLVGGEEITSDSGNLATGTDSTPLQFSVSG